MRRNTAQRRAIRLVFERSDRPLSTEEVLDAAQEYQPGLGIATVYRTLKALVEQSWLKTVLLPGMPPRYERADRPAHHHFYCGACGRAFEVPCSQVLLDAIMPSGFALESHDLVLYGRCEECVAAGATATQRLSKRA
jgi:Fur family transcriptional regulator, ferric uptake regulator